MRDAQERSCHADFDAAPHQPGLRRLKRGKQAIAPADLLRIGLTRGNKALIAIASLLLLAPPRRLAEIPVPSHSQYSLRAG